MLHFTKEIDYSLLLIASLADLQKGECISLSEVSKKRKLPYRFLGKIIIPLKKAGIVESIQGIKGGYRLTRDPQEIKIAEILGAYKESFAPVQCLDHDLGPCPSIDVCVTKPFWAEINDSLSAIFEKYTVKDFMSKPNTKLKSSTN